MVILIASRMLKNIWAEGTVPVESELKLLIRRV
jgi:hypothetical protein